MTTRDDNESSSSGVLTDDLIARLRDYEPGNVIQMIDLLREAAEALAAASRQGPFVEQECGCRTCEIHVSDYEALAEHTLALEKQLDELRAPAASPAAPPPWQPMETRITDLCSIACVPSRHYAPCPLAPSWTCQASKALTDPPQDCDWPFCGCDPVAEKVLDAVEESGRFTAAPPPWQPIETAPKDGTRILLARKQVMSGEVVAVSGNWNNGGAFNMPHWSTATCMFDPTHWMPMLPLPSPPASARPFSELREQMSPEAQQRAKDQADEILAASPPASEEPK